jgi:hypothetical protein
MAESYKIAHARNAYNSLKRALLLQKPTKTMLVMQLRTGPLYPLSYRGAAGEIISFAASR